MLWRNKRRPLRQISYLILITIKEDHAVRNSNRDCIISETISQEDYDDFSESHEPDKNLFIARLVPAVLH
jgi:hypothetical protein